MNTPCIWEWFIRATVYLEWFGEWLSIVFLKKNEKGVINQKAHRLGATLYTGIKIETSPLSGINIPQHVFLYPPVVKHGNRRYAIYRWFSYVNPIPSGLPIAMFDDRISLRMWIWRDTPRDCCYESGEKKHCNNGRSNNPAMAMADSIYTSTFRCHQTWQVEIH